ncbi:hypothetical protein [Bacillus sp. JCM 19041]|uniref:hypothetical protein n=1 Tax=Bacillus sp. JCM 19041 TaxID=1460637 RepID=UPI000A409563
MEIIINSPLQPSLCRQSINVQGEVSGYLFIIDLELTPSVIIAVSGGELSG